MKFERTNKALKREVQILHDKLEANEISKKEHSEEVSKLEKIILSSFECAFDVPDRPSVRQQLEFFSLISGTQDQEKFFRYWNGAQTLITNWDCEIMPDRSIDLDDIDNPDITDIIVWVGVSVVNHLNSLDELPKN